MQIDCASIILPLRLGAYLVAHHQNRAEVQLRAVIFCKLPNSAFEECAYRVSATPSHPM